MATVAEVYALAVQHHQAGNLPQAEQFCRQVLLADPSQADAHYLLGILAFQSQGRLDEAFEHFRQALRFRPHFAEAYNGLGNMFFLKDDLEQAAAHYFSALQLRPDYAAAYCNLGNTSLRQGKADEAIRCYRQALALKPDSAEALNNLGLALEGQEQYEQASRCYRQALQLNPHYGDAHCNLGNIFLRQERLDEAGQCYRQALRFNQRSADAWNNLGLTLERQENLAEAITCFRQALQLRPQFADAHRNLGHALFFREQFDEAVASYRQALQLNPHFAEALNGLGNVLSRQDRLDEAIVCFREALRLKPNFPEASSNLGNALLCQKKGEEAIACYRHSLHLNPNFAQAYDNLGTALDGQNKLDEAADSFRQALRVKPDFAEVHNRLGCTLLRQGRWDLATKCFQEALRLRPDLTMAQSNLLFCLNYDPAADPDEVFEEYCRWGRLRKRAAPPPPHLNDRRPERRLRIGYVSPDFRQHALMRYLEPVLAHHDSKNVEVICYAEVARPDVATARLQKLVQGWRSTVRLTDAQVAQRIRDDYIDILVDLAGHTGDHRLGVFADKPAPVQATWLGFLNTTGLDAVDYRLTDDILDPPGQPARDSEQLFRLDGGMCCFARPADAPAVTPLPALSRGHLTFGSLHNLFKLNGPVFDLWCRILTALPTARLLMYRDTLSGSALDYVRQQFMERGIAEQRLDLRHGPCTAGYLGICGEIDVCLDTFPATGGVTTCEALWMGVPVLSLCGARPMGRNSAALLTRAGLAEWIVPTPEDYIASAVRLENEMDRLAALRAWLRDRVAATLCDAERFTRVLEDAYRTIWRRWCAQQHG